MNRFNIIGICLIISFSILGIAIYKAVVYAKNCDRTVTVKGLAERECMANKVIWPIEFTVINNELPPVFDALDKQSKIIIDFLVAKGIELNEITVAAPKVIDKEANEYNDYDNIRYRYFATKIITVCSYQVETVKQAIAELETLGKHGIIFNQKYFNNFVEYLFTDINKIKPEMIEQATANARAVAQKFARDSQSVLGKIKFASQGSFSIENRDTNTPHIKKIRVVSTIVYYISD